MDEIHEVTGMKLAELRDATTERKQWRRLVMVVAEFQAMFPLSCAHVCAYAGREMSPRKKSQSAPKFLFEVYFQVPTM